MSCRAENRAGRTPHTPVISGAEYAHNPPDRQPEPSVGCTSAFVRVGGGPKSSTAEFEILGRHTTVPSRPPPFSRSRSSFCIFDARPFPARIKGTNPSSPVRWKRIARLHRMVALRSREGAFAMHSSVSAEPRTLSCGGANLALSGAKTRANTFRLLGAIPRRPDCAFDSGQR
jgi:hypothetical protein